MDTKILRAILTSSEDAVKTVENSEDYQKLLNEDKFLPKSDTVFDALCTSLTDLLCYKVSKEAYQRYSVRTNIIDILREWCRVTDSFKSLRAFRDGKQTVKFVDSLLKKYLTDEVLDNSDNEEALISLTSALMCLTANDSSFLCYLEIAITKLTELESTKEVERLLCYAVRNKTAFGLQLSTIEQIYISQKHKLIEEVLLNDFTSSCPLLKNNSDTEKSKDLMDQLIEVMIESPSIFRWTFIFLKEILRHLKYAPAALDFIQSVLKRVTASCESRGKSVLDLYPKDLQSCIILLRIEPSRHTSDSKSYTLHTLERIYNESKDDALVLVSHYPAWLGIFMTHYVRDIS